MTIKSFSKTDKSLTALISDGGKNQILRTNNSNPRWKDVLVALGDNNAEELFDLCSISRSVEKFTDSNIEVKDGNVYFKGRLLFGLDVTRLLEYMRDNIPYLRLLRFLENNQKNPSFRSIAELYKFLEYREMTLTEQGTVIGYKGVANDYYSIMGNKATNVTSGTVNDGGHILNTVGSEIRCDRSNVCDDYRQGCSPGLHIGSLEYAKSWGPRVMIVEFSPEDVVSVPDDCNCQKLRACAYKVIGEFTGQLVKETPETSAAECDENCGCDVGDDCDYDSENDGYTEADADKSYRDGYNFGLYDGKGHKARKHFQTDLDDKSLSPKEIDYITGYNIGYKRGRYGKK